MLSEQAEIYQAFFATFSMRGWICSSCASSQAAPWFQMVLNRNTVTVYVEPVGFSIVGSGRLVDIIYYADPEFVKKVEDVATRYKLPT